MSAPITSKLSVSKKTFRKLTTDEAGAVTGGTATDCYDDTIGGGASSAACNITLLLSLGRCFGQDGSIGLSVTRAQCVLCSILAAASEGVGIRSRIVAASPVEIVHEKVCR